MHGKGKMAWPNEGTYEVWKLILCPPHSPHSQPSSCLFFNLRSTSARRVSHEHSSSSFHPHAMFRVHQGDWVNDQREGKGRMEYKNGCIYEGDWKRSLFHGTGKVTYGKGKNGGIVKVRNGTGWMNECIHFAFVCEEIWHGQVTSDTLHLLAGNRATAASGTTASVMAKGFSSYVTRMCMKVCRSDVK